MGTLHVLPTDSAGRSMHQALRDLNRNDAVLVFPDDLSCGPIDSDELLPRVRWRSALHETAEIEAALSSFWGMLCGPHQRVVLWFGRCAAAEFAFLLACVDRLASLPYAIVDVTGLSFPARGTGKITEAAAASCVSLLWPDQLASLLGTEQEASQTWRLEMSTRWRQLKQENAPFRIATPKGLESAPIDVFDTSLLAQATTRWKKLSLIIGTTLAADFPPYIQTGPYMLLTRIVALIEAERLQADGDPWDLQSCRIRLPA